ncbi:hypothetical protein [Shouchella miscanthi]|uniref:Uncharacterized protein n=1 Tax=Shouchella miscanthi TaxID=2598861 RepID=A0ABU6NMV0_9BACI|nr:hypothetical protein [Shouchella miscanthi]
MKNIKKTQTTTIKKTENTTKILNFIKSALFQKDFLSLYLIVYHKILRKKIKKEGKIMRKVQLGFMSVILLASTLLSPLESFAQESEENTNYNPDDLEIPLIVKDMYIDDNGSLVTEYEDIEEIEYVGNTIVSVNGDEYTDHSADVEPSFGIMSACAPMTSKKLDKETKKATEKRLGWHPDFPKEGRRANNFWFSNTAKTSVTYNIGANFHVASIGISVAKGATASGWSISSNQNKWMRPATFGDLWDQTWTVTTRYTCPNRTTTSKSYTTTAKKIFYRAREV